SKLQSPFARRIGQRLDASVEKVAAAVEHHALDLGRLRVLCQQLADLGRLGRLVAFERLLDLQPGRGRDRPAVRIVDELGDDPPIRAGDDEAWPTGRSRNLAAHAAMPAVSRFTNGESAHARLPTFRRTY